VETFAGLAVEFGEFFKKEEVEWLLEPLLSSADQQPPRPAQR
jgi:hypothetical protein